MIPTRVSESGIALVFKPLFPLFPPEALESTKQSGMFALSEPGKLDQTLGAAGLTGLDDNEIEMSIVFDDSDAAERAFGRRAWGDAYHALLCADHATPLDVDDLDRLATAAYLTGRDLEFQHILERSVVSMSSQATGRALRAVRSGGHQAATRESTQCAIIDGSELESSAPVAR